MGFKVSENYSGGNYLNANDISKPFNCRITAVDMEILRDDSEKLCCSLSGTDKLLLLNKTNAEELADMFGDDTDGWIGKEIQVYTAATTFQGKRVKAVRVGRPIE